MRIPDHVLEAIRSRVSIVDVVGRHVALKRTGKNWKGLCPFHPEKTPSFVVNEERGTYHCFGCGAGGSVFRFVMEMEGASFADAVRQMGERAGVRVAEETPGERRTREEKGGLLEVLETAARYYRHQLLAGRAGEEARAYLKRRGVSAEASEAFRLGYAPAGWDNLARYLKDKRVTPADAATAGLVAERASGGHYDRLRDRLVFPIQDSSGRVVSFGGRVLAGGEPKYLNGPESPLFRKGEILYGLTQGAEALRRERRALVVEGYMDVIALHGHGFPTALATLGTALTPEHVRSLRRRADEAVLIYDGDAAGRKAAFRSLDVFLEEGFPCRAVLLPGDHDPDSFVREGGDLGSRIAQAKPLIEVFLDDLGSRLDVGSVEGRVAAVDEVVPRLRAVADGLARDLYLRRAAELLGVDEGLLRARLPGSKRPPAGPAATEAGGGDPVERGLVAALVSEPACRERFRTRDALHWLSAGPVREAAEFVSGRSEPPETLPVDEAPREVRAVLTPLLVQEAGPRHSYDVLEAKLELRFLEGRASRLVRELRATEAEGATERTEALLREKQELDRALAATRRRASGRG